MFFSQHDGLVQTWHREGGSSAGEPPKDWRNQQVWSSVQRLVLVVMMADAHRKMSCTEIFVLPLERHSAPCSSSSGHQTHSGDRVSRVGFNHQKRIYQDFSPLRDFVFPPVSRLSIWMFDLYFQQNNAYSRISWLLLKFFAIKIPDFLVLLLRYLQVILLDLFIIKPPKIYIYKKKDEKQTLLFLNNWIFFTRHIDHWW